MTVGMLILTSGGNKNIITLMLDAEGRGEVEEQVRRLLGTVPDGLANKVLDAAQERLYAMEPSCEISHLLYDCLRREVMLLMREPFGPASAANPLLKEYVPHQKKIDARERLDAALTVLTWPQRKYLFNRYYFLQESVPPYPKFERALAAAFQGKGRAKIQFHRRSLEPVPVSESFYLDVLNDLDPYYIARLTDIRSDIRFRKPTVTEKSGGTEARPARRVRNLWRCLPLILIILALVLFGFAYARNPFWQKWGL